MTLYHKLFWLLILLLPIQISRHFWPDWTQVLGLSIDYLSPTLYLTDILVMVILGVWLWDNIGNLRLQISNLKTKSQILKLMLPLSIFPFLLVNFLLAQNFSVAIYKLVKIIEFTLLGFYVAKNNYIPSTVRHPLSLAVIYSSLIAMIQFLKQGSIGGLFWWLGERTFSLMTPGIAKAIINGCLVMRPYATFSHPNVLAGFVLVSLILMATRNQETGVRRFLYWAALVLGGIAIAISFSRSAWLVGVMVGLIVISRHLRFTTLRGCPNGLLRGGIVLLVALISFGLFFFLSRGLSGQEAIGHRLALAQVAIEMIRTNPLAGVGLNNFISQLPNYWQQFGTTYWLQPVHNIFLLVAAETGLTGLMIFLWFLILTYKRLLATGHWPLVTALSAILVLGLFDHYWLTLQQPQLLLTIIFGLSWAKRGV